MLLIGLTGSISTGKSTVSTLLSSPPYSLPIIDADILARDVVLPSKPAYNAILSYFSSTTPDLLHSPSTDPISHPSGLPFINRAVLGRRVFGTDPQRRKDRAKLNSIVHPAVRKEMFNLVLRYWLRGNWAVVLDIPLLFESNLDVFCGKTLFVGISKPEVQLERLRARDAHLSEEDARHRIASQMDMKEKAELADEVIWNDGGREELKKEVEKFVESCRKGRGGLWTGLLRWVWPMTGLVVMWRLVVNFWLRRRRRSAKKKEHKL